METGRYSVSSSTYGTDEQRAATALLLSVTEAGLNSREYELVSALSSLATFMVKLGIYGSVSVKIDSKEVGSVIVNNRRININANVM